MALNSLIRKVPLLGSVDLTNFHADIHDYEGFEKDNSLFLNKRKVNWWKRNLRGGEIGELRGDIDGDDFKVYKNDSYIGRISRQYYKLETVGADEWRNDTLQKVANPFPQDGNNIFLFGGRSGKGNECTIRKCGDYYFTWKKGEDSFRIYDLLGKFYAISYITVNEQTPDWIDFYYSEEGYSVSRTFSDTTWEHPTVRLTIPAGCVYVCARLGEVYGNGYIYNPTTKTTSRAVYPPTGWTALSNRDLVMQNCAAVYYKDLDYGKQYCGWSFAIYGGVIYFAFYNWFSGYSSNSLSLLRQSTAVASGSPGQTVLNNHRPGFAVDFDLTSNPPYAVGTIKFALDETEYYRENFTTPDPSIFSPIRNYSKKYGKWAVNYVNNVATNIAHEYKKLYEVEGNEESGVVTDIDGYNDTYIYFHYGSDYYRISIQTAENFADVVTSLNGVYYIFNTLSYMNAYYSLGNDWFCSCDDWNDRVQWILTSDDARELQTTSRLNNNWQTKSDAISVSDLINSTLRNIAVKQTGDDYESDPDNIAPIYIDASYTCPEYTDQNGTTQKQKYTVYFPHVVPLDQTQSLVKEGTVSVDGWQVSLDEGDIFTDADVENLQLTPSLLGTQFLVYSTAVIIMNHEGGYLAMTSAGMGGAYVLIYLNETEVDPLKTGDSVFVINGVEYTYRAETNRILDYNGSWVCNTYLMKYLGFSTKYAYFYCDFDKAIYIFSGDNSMQKLVPLERYTPALTVYDGVGKVDTLNISSIDVIIVNLQTAIIILYENQYVIIETGKINVWEINESLGAFSINGTMYSLIRSSLATGSNDETAIEFIPIEIETQFYGDPENETNIINDCVYLTIDNLMSLPYGSVTVQAIGLQNQKVIKAEEKKISLKTEDFNELSQCLIKYQPKLQECKGFKLKIKSDFEIADLRIGTSQGAMNQTTKRI